jgi:predicted nucleic acid-binding protein
VIAWDTTVFSRLYPGTPLEQELIEGFRSGEVVSVAAPTVMETVRGVVASRSKSRGAEAWLEKLTTSDFVEVLPVDRHAAVVAGQLRALHPTPPTRVRRKGVKPEQRASWVLDIQIAACAWTHGRRLATHNVRDFECLSELIAGLHPDSSQLEIVAREAL